MEKVCNKCQQKKDVSEFRVPFVAKKVTKSKQATAEKVVNVCGEYLPDEVASVFHLCYESFLKKGFNCEQSFKLTLLVANLYLS